MKSFISTMALIGLLMPLVGCETLADSRQENEVRVRNAAALDLKQMNNDLEYILYIDRPVWLSRYPLPND